MKHPSGLFVLFITEMWERFSYYGMRAILTLYMINALKFDESTSSIIYGNYTGLVYLTPLIGGLISDRYWGNRRSIFVGGVLMAIAQFLLFGSASLASTTPDVARILLVLGLLLLIVGNGFFKPNISTMVGQLYPKGDSRVDSAFSIFYMGINLGAFFSPLICGYLGQRVGFQWGFLAAGIGMVASVIIFESLKNKYIVTPEGEPIGNAPTSVAEMENKIDAIGGGEEGKASSAFTLQREGLWLGVYAGLWAFFMLVLGFNVFSTLIFATSIASAGYIITDKGLSAEERQRIWVIYIIAFFVIFFWSAFEQAGASLTIFADKCVDLSVGSLGKMPSSFFQSVNPLAIIIFAPIFAVLWSYLGKRNAEPASPVKQAIGLTLLALGYLVIAIGVKGQECGKVPMFWLMAMYLIHTLGELCLSPIGLSMVVKLSPARLASLLMGVWFMSNAMANDFAGILSSYIPGADGAVKSFMGYQIANLYDFFMLFVFMCGTSAIILFLLSKKLLSMMGGIR
jgi:POT family proton-dependent oligopeptide transporter